MLGHTVLYDSGADDNRLLKEAANEQLVLLTRDEELYRRALARGIPTLLVKGEDEEERLALVARTYRIDLKIDMAATMCPECGGALRSASRADVVNQVPPTSLKLYDEFWKCENQDCNKVYWIGSHWEKIKQTLARSSRLVEEGA